MEELWPKIANILMGTNVCLIAVSFKLWLDARRERRLYNELCGHCETLTNELQSENINLRRALRDAAAQQKGN